MRLSRTKTDSARTSRTRKSTRLDGRARGRRFRPWLEQLEDRNLLTPFLDPGPDANISQFNDNQAEPTIAINYANPSRLFAAAIPFHGTIEGTFDQNFDWGVQFFPNVFQYHTPGLFAAYSTNYGYPDFWTGRIMATGGPNEPTKSERSLPAFQADPQATFDDFGNLFLTYLCGAGPPVRHGLGPGPRQHPPD